MTPINDVFMLSIDSKLDYETLRKICATGHSRVPVYEEVEVPTSGVIEARNKAGSGIATLPSSDVKDGDDKTMMVKRIVGIFLVKQVGGLSTLLNWHELTIAASSSVFSSILAVRLSSERELGYVIE